MSDLAKKAVVYIAIIVFSLSAAGGALEAVICLGPHGHIAVEAPHGACRAAGTCHEDAHDTATPVISDTGCSVDHGDCPGCIDIPLPGGKTHFYIGAFAKDAFDCLPAPHHNSEALYGFCAQNQSIVFSQAPGPPAVGLDTIILLI